MDLGNSTAFSGRFFGNFQADLGSAESQKEKVFGMRKKDYKGRTEKRMLSKCKDVCRTYDAIQSAYAESSCILGNPRPVIFIASMIDE